MKIQFEGGQVVEFDGQPTENDIHEVAASFEQKKPMFSSPDEALMANAKASGQLESLKRNAENPYGAAVVKSLQEFPAFANKAINTATMNIPEIIANRVGGVSLNPTEKQMAENPIATGIAEGIGFTAPTGAPIKAIKALNVIKNPLTRAVAQGAGVMATQLPVGSETAGDYAGKVGVGGAFGVAGRGVERLAEGALQKTAQGLSGRIGDYLVKLPTRAFRFSKDPVDVLAKEADGLVASNMSEYADKAKALLDVRDKQLSEAVAGSENKINILDDIKKHIDTARKDLNGSLINQDSKIVQLNELEQSLIALSNKNSFKELPIQDAIKMKRQLSKDFPFTKENSTDVVANAAHKMYWEINQAVEKSDPAIAELNHRVSGLIDIEQAAVNRSAVEGRNHPFGLVGRLAPYGFAATGLATGHGVEGALAGLATLGFEKVANSPALLTRVAKALSLMSSDEKSKLFLQYPKLKEAASKIYVDKRDIEVLKNEEKQFTVSKSRNIPRAETLDATVIRNNGTAIPYSKQELKALPNKSAEGKYNSVRDDSTIKLGDSGVNSLTINQGMNVDDLERYIQSRYEANAPQPELDALETLYAEKISGKTSKIPSKTPSNVIPSLKDLIKNSATEKDINAIKSISESSSYSPKSNAGSKVATKSNSSGSGSGKK